MPHIHTEPGQHDHTASAFLIRTDMSEPKILLHFHKKLKSYMQFGGHIELNETPWQAITHELKEESGYDMDQVRILQPEKRLEKLSGHTVVHPQPIAHMTHRFSETHFHTDTTYAFVTDQPPRHSPAEDESNDIQLFTRTELSSFPSDKIFEDVREIALYIFDNSLEEWRAIETKNFE
jgi:8-oxo-dGTP pyrophosphatase MutT (NUDIX family)